MQKIALKTTQKMGTAWFTLRYFLGGLWMGSKKRLQQPFHPMAHPCLGDLNRGSEGRGQSWIDRRSFWAFSSKSSKKDVSFFVYKQNSQFIIKTPVFSISVCLSLVCAIPSHRSQWPISQVPTIAMLFWICGKLRSRDQKSLLLWCANFGWETVDDFMTNMLRKMLMTSDASDCTLTFLWKSCSLITAHQSPVVSKQKHTSMRPNLFVSSGAVSRSNMIFWWPRAAMAW